MGEEKKGGCMVRRGKTVLFLEEEPEDEPVTRAGWRMEVSRGVTLFLSPESLRDAAKWTLEDKWRADVHDGHGRAAPLVSVLGGRRGQVPTGLGTNPAWEARNLLRPKQERPQRDSAQPLVSDNLSSA